MKKALGIGLLSVALAQSLYAVNTDSWSGLVQPTQPPAPPPVLGDDLTIFENSNLNFGADKALLDKTFGDTLYNGNILFNHNLNININYTGSTPTGNEENGRTTIYRADTQRTFSGGGILNINLNSSESSSDGIKALFATTRGTGSLTVNNKFYLTASQDSLIYSIFLNAGRLNFTNDLIIDLSQAKGIFNNNTPQQHGITNAKLLFDTAGDINVNANSNKEVTVQLTGDIANFGSTTLIGLANSNSFYRGDIHALNTSTTDIRLSNGATGEIRFFSHQGNTDFPVINLHLSNRSSAKVDTYFQAPTGSRTIFDISNSSLFADFHYTATGETLTTQGQVTLRNRGIWYMGQTNVITSLSISNHINAINKDDFLALTPISAVDFRYQDKGETLRVFDAEKNRYTLRTARIEGSNGVFRLKGVFNPNAWREVRNEDTGELTQTIATDLINTNQAFNTHYVQLFWNEQGFDKSLLNKDLEPYRIVVAQQNSIDPNSDFVGKETPIGIYNYITHLKKIPATVDDSITVVVPPQPPAGGGDAGGDGEQGGGDGNNQGNQGNNQNFLNQAVSTTPRKTTQGWQWIVSNVQRVDNSYLSRLLDSLYQAQFRISKMETDTLNLRMGELRDMQHVDSVWLRTKYGRLGSKSTPQTTPSWDEYTSVWFGYDRNFFVLGGKNFLGLALNTTVVRSHGIPEGIDDSNESYLGNSRTYGISVYDTFLFDNGLYIDAIAKYYLTDNHYSINSEVLRGNSPDFFTHSFLASVEVGKKFRLPIRTPDFNKSFYYLKPEAQMTFGVSSGTSWVFSDWSNQLINARLDFNTPVNFRTGLKFGRQFDKPFLKGDIYLGANIEYDINTGGDLRLEDFLDKMTLTHQGNFNLRLNAGTNLILNEYWRLYFDIDTAFFGNINSTFTLNGGVRINFGRLHPKMPNISPVFDYEEEIPPNPYRRTIPEVQNYSTQGILDNYDPKRKRPKLPPRVDVKSKKFGPPQTNPDLAPKFSITPKVDQNQIGEPTFNDTPQEIQAPQKNYTRDNQKPISPNVENQGRDLEGVYRDFQRGYNQN